MSALNCLNGLYRAVYFKFIKRVNLVDAPVSLSIGGVKLIQIDSKRGDGSKGSDIEGSGAASDTSVELSESPIHKNRVFVAHAEEAISREPSIKLEERVSLIESELMSIKDMKEELRSFKDMKEELRSVLSGLR